MKRLLLVAVVLASLAALAGENLLGTIILKGNSRSNLGVTGDAGFVVPKSSKLTAQCSNPDGGSANCYVCVSVSTCSVATPPGVGVRLTGNQALPTSSGSNTVLLSDGGTNFPVSAFSAEDQVVQWWTRSGTE